MTDLQDPTTNRLLLLAKIGELEMINGALRTALADKQAELDAATKTPPD